MRDIATRYSLTQFGPAERLLESLLNTFREWGGTGLPNIAILDWTDLPTADEFVLLRDFFVSRGVSTIICSPEQLEYEKGTLRCGEFPIDLVYKRVIIAFALIVVLIHTRLRPILPACVLVNSLQAGPQKVCF